MKDNQTRDAELEIVSSLLYKPEHLPLALQWVQSAHFVNAESKAMYSCLESLFAQSKPISALTLFQALQNSNLDQDPPRYSVESLSGLRPISSSPEHLVEQCRLVRNTHTKRTLALGFASLQKDCADPSLDPTQIQNRAGDILNEQFFQSSERNDRFSFDDSIGSIVTELNDLVDNPVEGGVVGLPTGFAKLDDVTKGLIPGNFYIIAGRPGMGKSSLATALIEEVSVQCGVPSLVFTLEMPHKQLTSRMISRSGRIRLQSLRTGQLSDSEWPLLTQTIHRFHGCPIEIRDRSNLTIGELRAIAVAYKRSRGRIGLIVVDYLQLMSSSKSEVNREQAIAEISRGLKNIAKELEVPVVALSQLNRSLEQRPNKRPVMSDLRESGSLEQDADGILFVYRDEVYNPDTAHRGMAEIIIGKLRDGSPCTVMLEFKGEFSGFYDPSPTYIPSSDSGSFRDPIRHKNTESSRERQYRD